MNSIREPAHKPIGMPSVDLWFEDVSKFWQSHPHFDPLPMHIPQQWQVWAFTDDFAGLKDGIQIRMFQGTTLGKTNEIFNTQPCFAKVQEGKQY